MGAVVDVVEEVDGEDLLGGEDVLIRPLADALFEDESAVHEGEGLPLTVWGLLHGGLMQPIARIMGAEPEDAAGIGDHEGGHADELIERGAAEGDAVLEPIPFPADGEGVELLVFPVERGAGIGGLDFGGALVLGEGFFAAIIGHGIVEHDGMAGGGRGGGEGGVGHGDEGWSGGVME